MWDDGFEDITNIDISESAIENMLGQQEKRGSDMKCKQETIFP